MKRILIVLIVVLALGAGVSGLVTGCGQEKEINEVNLPVGLFPISVRQKEGYIDRTGKVVISPQFDYATHFFDGLANVKIGDKYGYINSTGKMVITLPPELVLGSRFSYSVTVTHTSQ